MTTPHDSDRPSFDFSQQVTRHVAGKAVAGDLGAGRANSADDLPADIRGIDSLLRHLPSPASDMPSDLVDRIFIASRGLLPTPAPAVEVLAQIGASPRLRWARLAMAVAACVAVAAGTMVVFRTPVAKPVEFVAGLPDAPADEAMLVALLDGRDSSDTWVSDDTFNRNTFAQDVAPVLRSRDTDYVGLATEVQTIFGASLGVGMGSGVNARTEL